MHTSKHDTEHECWEVVVEIEDTSHEVEREVVQGPAK